jgi:hypothetical protein
MMSSRLPKQYCRDPPTIVEMQLVAQQSQEHAVCIWLIWVPLEARPLEPLRGIRLTIGWVDLDGCRGERQAKQRQPLLKGCQARIVQAMCAPVGLETAPIGLIADRVAGLREPQAASLRLSRR